LDPVTSYANEVLSGKIIAGRHVRLACQRHIEDLIEGPKRGLRWDVDASNWHLGFFPDVLRLAEGEHAGMPFELQHWQKFVQGSLFGWKRADGFRRFRNAYIEIGKGNGKSPMAGGTGLYMMAFDGEIGAHCFAGATSLDQADMLFQDAVKMVEASPALRKRMSLSGKRKVFNIADLATGSFFRRVSADHRGLDGKRVHFAALDEIHEHPTPLVVNKISAGKKGRRQPLIYEITNSGYDRNSICWQHHVYSEKVLEKHIPNDEWFAYVCGLDEGDDYKDEKVWIKANPNLGVSIPYSYVKSQVEQAQGMPADENLIKRLNFCIWTEQATRWMPMEKWDPCGELPIDAAKLKGKRCYGGLDLALTRDLSAFVLVFPPDADSDYWSVLCWFWIPRKDMEDRVKRDHVPYDLWEKQGFITVTPGDVTDHDWIEKKIKELSKEYEIVELAYDPSRAVQLVTHLQSEGLNLVDYAQTAKSMNAPISYIEKLVFEKKLAHGNHPILRMNCSNAVTVANSNGELKFDKAKATGRIDGMQALADAFGRARFAAPYLSVYDGKDGLDAW
jgi:phage terminase large subunit-like protein